MGLILTILMSGAITDAPAQTDPPRLRFGIAIGTDDSIRERIEPFRERLEIALDLPVDLFLIDTLGELMEALTRGDVDFARLSPSAYAAAVTICDCVEPLATSAPDDFPGRFYSILIGRDLPERTSVADLKDGKLGVLDPSSIAGYRVPLANLMAEGLDPRSHFQTLVRVQDSVDGIRAVLDGRVDAAFGWSTLAGNRETGYTAGSLNQFYVSGASGLDRLRIIWRSPAIPYSAYTIRKDVPEPVRDQLQAYLVDMIKTSPEAYYAMEPTFPGGLEPVVHADYRAVLRTYQADLQAVLEAN